MQPRTTGTLPPHARRDNLRDVEIAPAAQCIAPAGCTRAQKWKPK